MGRVELEQDYAALKRANDYCEARLAATCEFVRELTVLLRAAAGRAFAHNDLIGIAQGFRGAPRLFEGLSSRLEGRARALLEPAGLHDGAGCPELQGLDDDEVRAACTMLQDANARLQSEVAAADSFFGDLRAQLERSMRFNGRLDVMTMAEICTKLIPTLEVLGTRMSPRGQELIDQEQRARASGNDPG